MKTLKKICSIFIVFVFVFLFTSCKSTVNNSEQAAGLNTQRVTTDNKKDGNLEGQLKVHYIDVGQADCILIQQGNKNMLIDAGNNDDERAITNYLKSVGVNEFEYVIGTHPHEDHIGSLDYIVNSFKIGKIYFPKVTATTKTFENLANAVKNKGMKFTEPKAGETFELGKAKCTILAPNSSKYEDLNNYSIVVKVEFGKNSFLFTGDAEDVSEKEIISEGYDLKADVLKAGHHGSRSSSTKEFLDAVNPKYVVVSAGKDNDYGHPHKETLDKLNSRNIKIYRTDESGTIVASSDGKEISFDSHSVNNIQKAEASKNSTESKESSQADSNKSSKSKNSKVWKSKNGGKVYHYDKECNGMKNPAEITLKEAEEKGLKPCSKCVK